MNPKTLSRQAIRLAQRKSRKAGRVLTREEVLRLRIQTVEPWKRIVIVTIGLLFGALSLICYLKEAPVWIWAAFGLASAIIVLCGAFGRKAYLVRELKKLKDEAPSAILDAIVNGLIDAI
jgi:hypothetical protein